MKPFLAAFASILLTPVVSASPQHSFPSEWQVQTDVSNVSLQGENYQRLMHYDTWLDSRHFEAAKQQITMAGESRVDEQLTNNWQQLQQVNFSLSSAENRQLFANALLYVYRYKESMQQVGVDWFFQPNSKKKQKVVLIGERTQAYALYQALKLNQLSTFIEEQQSHFSQYQQMAAVKEHFNTLADVSWPVVNEPVRVVRDNDPLQSAEQVIDILALLGDISAEQAQQLKDLHLTYLSAELQEHIRVFQRRHGLYADGIIGPKTLAWLNASIEKRQQLLALNMLRLSLWPEDKKGIVVVNVPAFEMDVWVDEQRVFETRVIVGRPSRQTPIFITRLDSIVFNPGWNIPVKIMQEDIIPKAKRDESYLPSKGYQVIQSWRANAPVIAPEEIDWQTINPKRFPYRMRQPPGNSNALGRYKFNTPNDMAIYLHDTPGKSLFNRENRSLSSGCVRVEHASKFAEKLLTLSKKNPKDFEYLQKNEGEIKTKAISLRLKLPVHTIYQTAWVDDKGKLNFRNDIYDFDQPVIDTNIRQTVRNSAKPLAKL
ncbi:L,D-transpeptidase family protein [Motilimonas sp. E26]|uniref:L,D-transpeptidase family protein n=1 Tax=Motilimonas TaxID=1914248 RepID=UPI001E2C8755|nr:L,D-transpeptidase family protein [Motilimonas sp. E26]